MAVLEERVEKLKNRVLLFIAILFFSIYKDIVFRVEQDYLIKNILLTKKVYTFIIDYNILVINRFEKFVKKCFEKLPQIIALRQFLLLKILFLYLHNFLKKIIGL